MLSLPRSGAKDLAELRKTRALVTLPRSLAKSASRSQSQTISTYINLAFVGLECVCIALGITRECAGERKAEIQRGAEGKCVR